MSLLLQLFLMFIVTPLIMFFITGAFIVLVLKGSDKAMQQLSDDFKATPDLVRAKLAVKFRVG